jgi:hypothetical protein
VPFIPVVTLPEGKSVDSRGVKADLREVDEAIVDAVPKTRVASLALVIAATDLQLGISDADTVAKSGEAKEGLVALEESGIGEGTAIGRDASRRPPIPPPMGRWNGWLPRWPARLLWVEPSVLRRPATGEAEG